MDVSLKEKEHPLSLKVMRLTQPSLMHFHPFTCDKRDRCWDFMQTINQSDVSKPLLDGFPLGDLLTLPNTIGNIFLGEDFSCYISLHNNSNQVCRSISVKAELQTRSQRLTILSIGEQHPISQLLPDHSVDDVIRHEISELGYHMLFCIVNYTSSYGEQMHVRKSFKFQVLESINVKTKFDNAETDEVYLEVCIQNLRPKPIYMEQVCLCPSPQYTAEEMRVMEEDDGQLDTGGHYLSAKEVRQYLYHLSPRPGLCNGEKALKGSTDIGKLDIVWKSTMGEKGYLQTTQLQRMRLGHGDVRLTVESVPESVCMETTFTILCRFTNCCERVIDLSLTLHNISGMGVTWCGISGKRLGKLPQNGSLDVPLTLLAITPGLQTVSGLRVVDNLLKRTYEHDEICHVFVVNGND